MPVAIQNTSVPFELAFKMLLCIPPSHHLVQNPLKMVAICNTLSVLLSPPLVNPNNLAH